MTPTPSRPPEDGPRPEAVDQAAKPQPSESALAPDTQPAGAPRTDSGARAIASLQALQTAIEQAASGLSVALGENTRLSAELDETRASLERAWAERDELRNRVLLLEQQLEEALREAERSRDFLIAEQDAFLAGLLEEHERAVAQLARERDAALEHTPAVPPASTNGEAPRATDAVEVARPSNAAQRTTPGLAPPPGVTPLGVTPPVEPSIENVEKLVAERERTRDVLKRLQAQRDEAQRSLADLNRERDELRRELSKLAPERFDAERAAWSPQASRRTVPAIPQIVARATDPSPSADLPFDDLDESLGDRVTAPPSEDVVAAIKASRPSPAAGTPAQELDTSLAVGVDGKPLLKRKPDPAQRSLGGYSIAGETDAPKSDRDRR